MPLEMRKDSSYWYGRFKVNGKRLFHNLGVKIPERRPDGLKKEGTRAFEDSRLLAQAALDALVEQSRAQVRTGDILEKLYEARTQEKLTSIQLADMATAWLALPRKRKLSYAYTENSKTVVGRFTDYMAANHSKATSMSDVTRNHAEAFLGTQAPRKLSPRTYNAELSLLKTVFYTLRFKASLSQNPFDGIPTRERDTIHREPFTPEELKAIVDAAEAAPLVRGPIVTAICTAMRRADCCLLRWNDVNLKDRMLTVKTSKTGETVDIPVFPMLEKEFSRNERGESEYVFPEAAAMMKSNPDGITDRVQAVLETAGIKARNKARTGTKQRVSTKDFHSFRTSWITLALSAGVPMELVRRVTGHTTTELVLKHYFRPGQEQFRTALTNAMPKLLTEGEQKETVEQKRRRLVKSLNGKNWKKIKAQLLKICDRVQNV